MPIIFDVNNSSVNRLNTFRTIRAFENSGIAGLHIEDQAISKRCRHLEEKELIPLDDYLPKIHATADAMRNINKVWNAHQPLRMNSTRLKIRRPVVSSI